MHKRTAIRNAIVAKLIAASTAAGSRVKTTRLEPARNHELPCISVYSDEDPVDQERTNATAPRKSWREYRVGIVGWVVGTSENLDDLLDDLAAEIERAMGADEQLTATCEDSVLINTSFGMKTDGNRPLGAVELTYSIAYYTDVPDLLDQDTDDLEIADIRITSLDGGTTELQEDEQPFEAHDQLTGLDEE